MRTLILLHGALGAHEQLAPLKGHLENHYKIYTPDFSGHGGKPFETEFSITQFARELITFLSSLPDAEKPVHVFGYSMGGYVATFAALQQPEFFSKVITLATKWQWDTPAAAREASMLDAGTLEAKVPAYAAKLKAMHAPNDWKTLLSRTAAMLLDMGQRPPIDVTGTLPITVPVCLLVGDRDKTVSVEETLNIYRNISQASFGVLPGTPHPFEKADIDLLSALIRKFLI
jgi:pimeloyl-ACP methyl ester carboxylesterase